MSSVVNLADRKDRPAYVRFERVAKEDVAASKAAGKYVAKDEDLALITPPYSKDVFKQRVSDWLAQLERDMQAGRVPQEWIQHYQKQYDAWRNGQELPLNGTAIKGWGVISPAQQETLIRMNVLTVEDLAAMNDEGLKRVGMGAVDLKNKAKAWLAQLQDKGPLTLKMAAIERENDQLKGQVETLTRQVEDLMTAVRAQQSVQAVQPVEGISAADIMDEPPARPVLHAKRK